MRLAPALLALALLAGCASSGTFPSLAQRPIERELPPPDVEPVVSPVPDDPAMAARIDTFRAEARRAAGEFDAAYPEAEAAVRRAGAAGSESWTLGQQALSRLQAAQASAARALADFDTYSLDAAKAKPVNPNDLDRLQAAVAEVQRLVDSEHERVARLEEMLKAP